jgi:hypothetical protein
MNIDAMMQIDALLGKLSADQLLMVARSAQTRAQAKVKVSFQIGDEVQFDAKSRGMKRGILIKKNPKTFQVLVGSVTWKVSPTLLRKAA